jgi:opacity protein-like surface antigen
MLKSLGLAAAALLVCAGVANAEERQDKQGDFNVFVHGGVGDFTGDLGTMTSTGPTWGINVNVQPWNVLGYEIAYDGSRNLINDPRLPDAAALTRHGLSAMLRLAPPFIEKVRPYVGVGLGVTAANVDETKAGGLYRNDLMEEVPLAAGLEFNTGAVTAGFRTSYRLLMDEGFADPAVPGNPEGGYLDASLTLGGRF